jgi:DNA gyrase/topoisomerase IV subunit B
VLKGKPLNVWDLKRDIVYKNDEMYNLMRSLDIEDNLEGLRYEKVIADWTSEGYPKAVLDKVLFATAERYFAI